MGKKTLRNDDAVESADRREALVKIGKYAAYTAPAMLVTVRPATAGGSEPPSPTSTAPPPS